jgi:Holliday junction DNA helicase RuvB
MVIDTHFSGSTSKNTKETVVSTQKTDESEVFENILRPQNFADYIGQKDVKNNLKIFTTAARERGESLDHTLFYGPPGLGKTTLSLILAHEMEAEMKITSGPTLEKPGDLAALLTNLQEGDFLFIDEIHRLRRPIEEILYTAMEDFAIDIVVGKGPSARTMRLSVPRFTLVGATTQASLLSGPLRDRFGHVEKLRFYESDEIRSIIERSAKLLKVKITPEAATKLSQCARCTPRVANRLLRRMRDFAQVWEKGVITESIVERGLKSLSIDTLGLDHSDQEYLEALCQKFGGGPVGLSTLAAATGEDENTIQDMIEPFLIRLGFLQKTPRGRMATKSTFLHLGITPPTKQGSASLF